MIWPGQARNAGIALAVAAAILPIWSAIRELDLGALLDPARGPGVAAPLRLRPMSDETMFLTIPAIALGIALIILGTLSGSRPRAEPPRAPRDEHAHGRDWQLVSLLTIALMVDTMKPFTIGFVLPGLRAEYGLTPAEAVVLPFVALSGTAIGSILWGVLADRAGRHAAIVLATVLFIATSTCGLMPEFYWNVLTCLVMGMSAGGLLPVTFALIAEVVPLRHRGPVAVLVGGLGSSGGYLAASAAAYTLEPVFGWRALWLVGLPTGLFLLAVAGRIPKSPTLRTQAQAAIEHHPRSGASVVTAVVRLASLALFGLAWGIANFGVLTWLPSLLRGGGNDTVASNAVLSGAAVAAVVLVPLAALAYARWRKSALTVTGALVALVLAIDALFPWLRERDPVITSITIAATLALLAAAGAILLPFAAESYPSAVRSSRVGLVAASTKVGGLIGPLALLSVSSLGDDAVRAMFAPAAALLVAVLTVAVCPTGADELQPAGRSYAASSASAPT